MAYHSARDSSTGWVNKMRSAGCGAVQLDPGNATRKAIAEATASAVLASAILATAGGVFWMVSTLPRTIEQLSRNVETIKDNLEEMQGEFHQLERRVDRHEDRLNRIER